MRHTRVESFQQSLRSSNDLLRTHWLVWQLVGISCRLVVSVDRPQIQLISAKHLRLQSLHIRILRFRRKLFGSIILSQYRSEVLKRNFASLNEIIRESKGGLWTLWSSHLELGPKLLVQNWVQRCRSLMWPVRTSTLGNDSLGEFIWKKMFPNRVLTFFIKNFLRL